jgi:hypothetical protein
MLSLFLLPLLLLSPMAQAQTPPPFDWSITPAACQPDDQALRRGLKQNTHSITLHATALAPLRPGAGWPVVVRCPIVAQGVWLWRELELVYHDTDGGGDDASLLVALKRHEVIPPRFVRVETVLRFTTRGRASDPDTLTLTTRGIGAVVADFTRYTYWIELGLSRTTLVVRPPKWVSVRLRYVPTPPEE